MPRGTLEKLLKGKRKMFLTDKWKERWKRERNFLKRKLHRFEPIKSQCEELRRLKPRPIPLVERKQKEIGMLYWAYIKEFEFEMSLSEARELGRGDRARKLLRKKRKMKKLRKDLVKAIKKGKTKEEERIFESILSL